MPLYEYACRACGTRFEAMRKLQQRLDAPPCPACAATKATLAMSVPARVGAVAGGASGADFDCGAPGGCCGGSCSVN